MQNPGFYKVTQFARLLDIIMSEVWEHNKTTPTKCALVQNECKIDEIGSNKGKREEYYVVSSSSPKYSLLFYRIYKKRRHMSSIAYGAEFLLVISLFPVSLIITIFLKLRN